MNYIQYPHVGNSPVGMISWKSLRMSQMAEARWNTIETSAGIYSSGALTTLDSIITFQRQNGVTIHGGMYATPLFYADDTTNNPNFHDHATLGPWNFQGEGAFPTSLAAVTNFVTMIINRYNKPGGAWYDANFATLGKGIQFWETWNEPNMLSLGNAATSSGQKVTSFWWGTPGQTTDMCYTQYAAIKAADPSVVVLSPGFAATAPAGALNTFLTTAGIANPTKTGLLSCDAIAYHPYFMGPPGFYFGTLFTPSNGGSIVSGTFGVATWASWLKQNGYMLPLYINEWGFDSGSATTNEVAWYAQSATFKYNWIARTFMCAAACGAKCVMPWNWSETGGSSGNSGDWQADTNGVQKAYNDFAANVVGKTIVSGTYVLNGPVTLNFSDGTSWTV